MYTCTCSGLSFWSRVCGVAVYVSCIIILYHIVSVMNCVVWWLVVDVKDLSLAV